jgi:hypothetical protein
VVSPRNLTIPQFAPTVQWQKIIPNIFGLTSKCAPPHTHTPHTPHTFLTAVCALPLSGRLYLFSADHLVIIDYNALSWSIDSVVALPTGQYPMQVIRNAMVNVANQQELFVTRANEDPEKPGEVSFRLRARMSLP